MAMLTAAALSRPLTQKWIYLWSPATFKWIRMRESCSQNGAWNQSVVSSLALMQKARRARIKLQWFSEPRSRLSWSHPPADGRPTGRRGGSKGRGTHIHHTCRSKELKHSVGKLIPWWCRGLIECSCTNHVFRWCVMDIWWWRVSLFLLSAWRTNIWMRMSQRAEPQLDLTSLLPSNRWHNQKKKIQEEKEENIRQMWLTVHVLYINIDFKGGLGLETSLTASPRYLK